jgi:uncharacterized protein YhbP (UPF0306 family)
LSAPARASVPPADHSFSRAGADNEAARDCRSRSEGTPRARDVRRFVDSIRTLTLACADGDGPWAADVCFARVGADLCFLSSPESRHARALAADPRAAATIHGEFTRWEEIRGVQIAGRVVEVEGAIEKARAMTAYFRKFPFARGLVTGAAALLAGRFRLYRLEPEEVLLVDNREGFGARPVRDWGAQRASARRSEASPLFSPGVRSVEARPASHAASRRTDPLHLPDGLS